jgi:hypothetical protein
MGLEACYSGRQKMLSCGSGSLTRRRHSAIWKANVQFGRGNMIKELEETSRNKEGKC